MYFGARLAAKVAAASKADAASHTGSVADDALMKKARA
jgi:hypothetical protein